MLVSTVNYKRIFLGRSSFPLFSNGLTFTSVLHPSVTLLKAFTRVCKRGDRLSWSSCSHQHELSLPCPEFKSNTFLPPKSTSQDSAFFVYIHDFDSLCWQQHSSAIGGKCFQCWICPCKIQAVPPSFLWLKSMR